MALAKHEDTFWARLAVDGTVALYRTQGPRPGDRDEPLVRVRRPAFRPYEPVVLRFENVDYHVSLWIDNVEVLATADDQYRPDLAHLRSITTGRHGPKPSAPPRIVGDDLEFELWHVALWRDVYYVSMGADGELNGTLTGWGTTNHPIWLRDREYFMLGDNSPASKDSRLVVGPWQPSCRSRRGVPVRHGSRGSTDWPGLLRLLARRAPKRYTAVLAQRWLDTRTSGACVGSA